ncbi:uncharacterized protein SCHCODRAFT_02506275 [Schizophyllum commune H4-8]|nr:uncharacterized protein SCHCODRAFT_02506275 [Schizophyllum commune H4-8]KAI5891825.1 hypothetical protein SCHCODRAFT_02506275 [Schizophyllum commune H4-8]
MNGQTSTRRHRLAARALMAPVGVNTVPANPPTPVSDRHREARATAWQLHPIDISADTYSIPETPSADANPVSANIAAGANPMIAADSNPAHHLLNASPEPTPTGTSTHGFSIMGNPSLTVPALCFLGLGATLVGGFMLYFATKYACRGVKRLRERRRAGEKEVDVEGQRTEADVLWAQKEVTEKPTSFAVSVGSVQSQAEFTDARAQVWFGRMEGVPVSDASLVSKVDMADARQVYPAPGSPLAHETCADASPRPSAYTPVRPHIDSLPRRHIESLPRPSRPALTHSDSVDSPASGRPCPPLYGRIRSDSENSHGSARSHGSSRTRGLDSPALSDGMLNSPASLDSPSSFDSPTLSGRALDSPTLSRAAPTMATYGSTTATYAAPTTGTYGSTPLYAHAHAASVDITTATCLASNIEHGLDTSASATGHASATGNPSATGYASSTSAAGTISPQPGLVTSVSAVQLATSASADDARRFSQRTHASVYTLGSAYSQETYDWRRSRGTRDSYRARDSASTWDSRRNTTESASTYRTRDSRSSYRTRDSRSSYRTRDSRSSYRTRDSASTLRTRDSASSYRTRNSASTFRSMSTFQSFDSASTWEGRRERRERSESRASTRASRAMVDSQITPTRASRATIDSQRTPTRDSHKTPTRESNKAPTRESQRTPTRESQRTPTRESQKTPTRSLTRDSERTPTRTSTGRSRSNSDRSGSGRRSRADSRRSDSRHASRSESRHSSRIKALSLRISSLPRLSPFLLLLHLLLLVAPLIEGFEALGSFFAPLVVLPLGLSSRLIRSEVVVPECAHRRRAGLALFAPYIVLFAPHLVLFAPHVVLFAPHVALLASFVKVFPPYDEIVARVDPVGVVASVAGLVAGKDRDVEFSAIKASRSAAAMKTSQSAVGVKTSHSAASVSTRMVIDAFPEVPSSSEDEEVGLAYDRLSQATLEEASASTMSTPTASLSTTEAPAAVQPAATSVHSVSAPTTQVTTRPRAPSTPKTRRATAVVGMPRTPTQRKRAGYSGAKASDAPLLALAASTSTVDESSTIGDEFASEMDDSPGRTPRARMGMENIASRMDEFVPRRDLFVPRKENVVPELAAPRNRSVKARRQAIVAPMRSALAPLRLAHGQAASQDVEVFGRF